MERLGGQRNDYSAVFPPVVLFHDGSRYYIWRHRSHARIRRRSARRRSSSLDFGDQELVGAEYADGVVIVRIDDGTRLVLDAEQLRDVVRGFRTIGKVRPFVTCPSRIRCQAATGSWTRSLQWETQRTLFSSARVTGCPPAKVSGVWPSNDAWLRAAL
jgi:hypothetical protein